MSAATRASRKLPRVANADRPRDDETVMKRTGADLQNGWLSRHGELYITDDRLVFVPTLLDTVMRAKRREIALDEVTEIERFPISPNQMPPGGRRPRLLVHTADCIYEFMVGDLDAWIDSLQRVYQLRARKGNDHAPVITREGYVNVLMDEA